MAPKNGGKSFFSPDFLTGLSEDHLVLLIADMRHRDGAESKFCQRLVDGLGLEWEDDEIRKRACRFMGLSIQTPLVTEYIRRQGEVETPKGRALREFLNEPNEENRGKLLKFATRKLKYHPELGPPEDKQVIQSMADVALVKRINKLPGWDRLRERLKALIDGAYDRVVDKQPKVGQRYQLTTLEKRSESAIGVSIDAQEPDEARGHTQDRILREFGLVVNPSVEHDVLIKELLTSPKLCDEDRELLQQTRAGYS